GGVNLPINVATGGPAGVGDRFLQIMSSGSGGAGGKLVAFNRTRWNGNYMAAPSGAVTSIAFDLKEVSGSPLKVRIAMKGSTLQTAPGYASTNGFDLTADGLWHHVVFGIDAASLTAIGTPLPLSTFLTSVAELRILSSAVPALDGDSIAANLG